MSTERDGRRADATAGAAEPPERPTSRALRRALLLDERRVARLRRRQRGVQPRRLPVPRLPRDHEPA